MIKEERQITECDHLKMEAKMREYQRVLVSKIQQTFEQQYQQMAQTRAEAVAHLSTKLETLESFEEQIQLMSRDV